MLFHSQVFVLLFLPVVIALYYWLAASVRAREWALIAASLFFYGWWDVRFLPLLVGQTIASWAIAKLHERRPSRWTLVAGIALNLAILGLFKYFDFGVSVVEDLTGATLPRANLILPIGISFYTFQIVSYLSDLMRGEAQVYGLRRFSLFVVLFPQLIAGPIVRHNEIVPQFDLDPCRAGLAERLGRGAALFVIGLGEKVLIADRLAKIADPAFETASRNMPDLGTALAGTLAFSLQIYFDFLAYSDMAIGVGLMMGLTIPMNFNLPYRSLDIREFWRRWHMTLSRFLRDYLYIPLGGSRQGPARYLWATIVTMGLCGLWHGAGWTFVLWGLGHGAGLIVCRAWQTYGRPLPSLVAWAITFTFVVVLFVLFRSPDMATFARMMEGLTAVAGLGERWPSGTIAIIAVALALALVNVSSLDLALNRLRPMRTVASGLAVLTVVCVLEVGKGQPVNFIYFQF